MSKYVEQHVKKHWCLNSKHSNIGEFDCGEVMTMTPYVIDSPVMTSKFMMRKITAIEYLILNKGPLKSKGPIYTLWIKNTVDSSKNLHAGQHDGCDILE